MRTEYKVFTGMGLFMIPLGVVYWIWDQEEAGSLLLIVTAVAFLFVGVYLYIQARRMNGLRPEDYNATPEEGAGEVGSFPVGSIWPLVAAGGVTLGSLGLVFNGFLAIPGLTLILLSVIGMARESEEAGLGHAVLDHNVKHGAHEEHGFTDQVKK